MPEVESTVRTALESVEKAVDDLQEVLEHLDVVAAIEAGEATVVYPCSVHARHENGMPVYRVTNVVSASRRIQLGCGHALILPSPEMRTAIGEELPCVWCYGDCHA